VRRQACHQSGSTRHPVTISEPAAPEGRSPNGRNIQPAAFAAVEESGGPTRQGFRSLIDSSNLRTARWSSRATSSRHRSAPLRAQGPSDQAKADVETRKSSRYRHARVKGPSAAGARPGVTRTGLDPRNGNRNRDAAGQVAGKRGRLKTGRSSILDWSNVRHQRGGASPKGRRRRAI